MQGPPLTTAEIRSKLERELTALTGLGLGRVQAIDAVATRHHLTPHRLREALREPGTVRSTAAA